MPHRAGKPRFLEKVFRKFLKAILKVFKGFSRFDVFFSGFNVVIRRDTNFKTQEEDPVGYAILRVTSFLFSERRDVKTEQNHD